MKIPLSKRLVGAVASLALVAGGSVIAANYLRPGTAQAAVQFNRVQLTCNKQGQWTPTYWRRQVDPIKSYGVPVSAHSHDFAGVRIGTSSNQLWSAKLEADASIAANHPEDPGYSPLFSSCPMYGYWPTTWTPTALLNGVATNLGPVINTYQAPQGVPVITPPFGEAMVTGDASATQTSPHVRYTCGDAGVQGASIDGSGSDKPFDCSSIPGGAVTGEITFPDCWDGQGVTKAPNGVLTFDQPYGIGTSHFSYSVGGKCIAGSIPCVPGQLMAQVVQQIQWIDNRPSSPDFNKPLRNPLNPDGTMALSFSSGSYTTLHGDYLNTQNMTYLGTYVDYCLNTAHPCPFGTHIRLHDLI